MPRLSGGAAFPRKQPRTPHRAMGCLHYGHSCLGAHGKRSASSEEDWATRFVEYLDSLGQPPYSKPIVRTSQSQPIRPITMLKVRPVTVAHSFQRPSMKLKQNPVYDLIPNGYTVKRPYQLPFTLKNLARVGLPAETDGTSLNAIQRSSAEEIYQDDDAKFGFSPGQLARNLRSPDGKNKLLQEESMRNDENGMSSEQLDFATPNQFTESIILDRPFLLKRLLNVLIDREALGDRPEQAGLEKSEREDGKQSKTEWSIGSKNTMGNLLSLFGGHPATQESRSTYNGNVDVENDPRNDVF
ncbi:uncharacterized protein LOC108675406, partial [Hyalella azteca]|uniref:Uncharacterized protein LOC108675406 n=1 Tax=Hyalella azteca TaxID=294128 RepID=A0A8B7NYS9_HYAAZ